MFYVDDHFISYTGAQPAGKGWNNRRGRAGKGRFDTLVTSRGGAAAGWSTTEPSGLSRTLPPALGRLRGAVGPDRRLLLGFDRGGAYPQVFTQIRAQHAGWITCRRAPLAPTAQLPVLTTIVRSGQSVPVAVAGELVTLDGYHNGDSSSSVCRQLSVFEHGKVVLQVLTSDLDSCAAWLLEELIGRWGIENVIKYGTEHYGTNLICDYAFTIVPGERIIKNPARKAASTRLKSARAALDAARAGYSAMLSDPDPEPDPPHRRDHHLHPAGHHRAAGPPAQRPHRHRRAAPPQPAERQPAAHARRPPADQLRPGPLTRPDGPRPGTTSTPHPPGTCGSIGSTALPGTPASTQPPAPRPQPTARTATPRASQAPHPSRMSIRRPRVLPGPGAIHAETAARHSIRRPAVSKPPGNRADEFIGYHRAHGTHLVLSAARAQVTCRSRYTEDRLADSVRRGVTQYVILGAGLDSFGYRSDLAGRVRVFEVDHPATQRWKRQVLAAARIPVPAGLTFVPVDFESDALAERLAQGGFDPSRPALVSWLGVTMYLTRAAIGQTLAVIGRLAPGTEVVADYMLPAGLRDEAGNSYAQQIMPVAAQRGEPWLTFLSPDDMSGLPEEDGFGFIEHVRQRDTVEAAVWNRSDSLRPIDLSCLAHATITQA